MPTSTSSSSPKADKRFDRRAYRRVQIEQFCRMIYHGREYPCEVIDVSEGGAGLKTKVVPEIGESIILYFDDMGRVRAEVVRHLDNGCGVAFTATQIKRDRVVQRLDLLVKNGRTQSLPHERLLLEVLAGGEGIRLTELRDDSILKRTLDECLALGWIEWTVNDGVQDIKLTDRGRMLGPLPK